ncbi:hypothetical protein FNV43_RR18992 [Rhamnella rubrinervis]|uniref:Uncharacterized protein n=1 Tax=Rhamnella rubrinervis TaxID=2594499 RepID=A0A8K0E1R1_9ROSA|nr:hypothetical protein FNV43_RR18992 [Rhamnella rubrinervis]
MHANTFREEWVEEDMKLSSFSEKLKRLGVLTAILPSHSFAINMDLDSMSVIDQKLRQVVLDSMKLDNQSATSQGTRPTFARWICYFWNKCKDGLIVEGASIDFKYRLIALDTRNAFHHDDIRVQTFIKILRRKRDVDDNGDESDPRKRSEPPTDKAGVGISSLDAFNCFRKIVYMFVFTCLEEDLSKSNDTHESAHGTIHPPIEEAYNIYVSSPLIGGATTFVL